MTNDKDVSPASAPAKAGLQVIAGGREEIERAALEAVFTAPEQLPALLKRLAPAEGRRLGLVAKDDAGA